MQTDAVWKYLQNTELGLLLTCPIFQATEYVYEAELEESYRKSLFKSFNKTLDDGFFPMVILDCVNDKVDHFDHFWSIAKQKGFEVITSSSPFLKRRTSYFIHILQ
jgi:hypothetical protein